MPERKISRPSEIPLPSKFPTTQLKGIEQNLSLKLHADDAMYWGDAHHYLSVGASALNIVRSMQMIAELPNFESILDFGAGAGRVTRWLRAAYPEAKITAAEIRQRDLEFCENAFGTYSWNSGIDIDTMEPPAQYDLIWIGSVLTHLSEGKSKLLLQKAVNWCKPNGLALVTFHGRSAYSWRNSGKYIKKDLLPEIEAGYEKLGFGYSDYPGQHGYGVAFCTPTWITRTVEEASDCRLVGISERVWDKHHDVVALQHL